MTQKYDALETLAELDGGVFSAKLSKALRDVALGVTEHNRKGKVVVEFTMDRIGESNQVALTHKVKYDRPTRRGKTLEEDTTQTPMYVEQGGALVLVPTAQGKLFPEDKQ